MKRKNFIGRRNRRRRRALERMRHVLPDSVDKIRRHQQVYENTKYNITRSELLYKEKK